jgi:hypothetical protein
MQILGTERQKRAVVWAAAETRSLHFKPLIFPGDFQCSSLVVGRFFNRSVTAFKKVTAGYRVCRNHLMKSTHF